MYGIFTFFMVSTQSQLEATIYNMTSKAFTSTNIINVKGTITVNWMYFRNNTLLYMYGYDNSVDSQYNCVLPSILFDFYHVICGRFLIIVNIEQGFAKLFVSTHYSIEALQFTNDSMFIGLTDVSSRSSSIIYKSDFMLNFNSKCKFFTEILANQTSFPYGVNYTDGIHQNKSIDFSLWTVVLMSGAQQYFNISQTDIVIFDLFITDLFWPQTIASADGTACQMTPPQIYSNQTTWNLKESNLELTYAPFYHCQGVPIILTKVTSAALISSYFKVNEDQIIIQYTNSSRVLKEDLNQRRLQINPGDTLIFNITAATNTKIPLTNSAIISIYVNNTAPEYIYFPSIISSERQLSTSFQILYGSLNDSRITNSTIVISDIDFDSIFLSLSINGVLYQSSPFKFNNQSDFESISLNTTNLNIGSNTLELNIWDMFHTSTPNQIHITLNITYDPAPHFINDLPSGLVFSICTQSILQLPAVQDLDNDFSQAILLNSNKWCNIQGLDLILNPTSAQIGEATIEIKLADLQGHFTDYSLKVDIQDSFEFQSLVIKNKSTTFPYPLDINIDNLISQFQNRIENVYLKENGESINWCNYIETEKVIRVDHYTTNMIGIHNLTISIFDSCYLKYFDSYVILNILPNLPPAIVGNIDEVIGYQGQSMIVQKNINKDDLFYDPVDEVKVVMIECIDNKTLNLASTMIKYIENSSIIESSFYKSYVGVCTASILGYDVLYQASILQYYINILKCPQSNCLYCEGPNLYDCTKCIIGYTLESSSKQCIMKTRLFDKWVIIGFAVYVCLVTIMSEHDTDISILLLENISIYFVLFIVK